MLSGRGRRAKRADARAMGLGSSLGSLLSLTLGYGDPAAVTGIRAPG